MRTDMHTTATECVSQGPGGPGTAASRQPTMSGDGRLIAFVTPAPTLDRTGAIVVWVSLARNLTRGVTGPPDLSQILRQSLAAQNAVVELLSQASGAAGNGASQRPSIDRAGQLTVFQTGAANLGSGDTNGQDDVLLVVIPVASSATPDRVVITAPANGSVLPLTAPTPLTVMWTTLSGVAQYGLEFTGADRVFANPNGTGADGVNGFGGAGGAVVVPDTSFPVTLDPSFPAGVYQVRVVGLTAGFQPVGRFSDAVSLTIQ